MNLSVQRLGNLSRSFLFVLNMFGFEIKEIPIDCYKRKKGQDI